MGFGVPVKSDMADFRGGNKREHAVYHSKARPQNGDDCHLFAGDNRCHAGFDGGFDFNLLCGQVA